MKKLTLLISSLLVVQYAFSQKLIIENGIELRRGVYNTFDEFRYNSPTTIMDFDIVKVDTGLLYHLNIDIEKIKELGPIWGVCDGKNVYINRDYNMSRKRVLRRNSQFNRIIYLGRYCYFLTLPSDPRILFPQPLPFVIDINTGNELCLNCALNAGFLTQSEFKKIMTKDSDLWDEYKHDKTKGDLFLKYIKLYSEKNRDEVEK